MINRLNENGEPRTLFGTRFWGFDPLATPFCGFLHQGTRDNLIKNSVRGDVILVLGTMTDNTAPEDQGRLLGLIEFARTGYFAEDLIENAGDLSPRLFDENGKFKWPYAVPAIRAWRFVDRPSIHDVIGRQLNMAAITGVDRLSTAEANSVLECDFEEIPLPATRAAKAARRQTQATLDRRSPGQPGPRPSEWSALVARQDGPTATYLMQFGDTNVFKVGISKNPSQRRDALNFSVPVELLKMQWEFRLSHVFASGREAYDMEQAVLKRLSAYSQVNERVLCAYEEIQRAWSDYLAGQY